MVGVARRQPSFGCRALATLLVALGAAAPQLAPSTAAAADANVAQLRIDGVINVFTADYITAALDRADRSGASAVLVTMDTPGGIDTSMRKIIQAILSSRLPVIVYVSPSGARGASAGLFISQAADVVAMAPGTNIGSAHPVLLDTGPGGGSSTSTAAIEDQKVLNDSVAYIRSLAEVHHRNADWAADAVRNSANVTADEAVRLHVADMISPDVPALLRQVDGRQVDKNGRTLTLHTATAQVTSDEMGFFPGLLHVLADPQIALLLMLLAILAIGFEVTHPGAVLPGVVGVLSGILALVSFESLPVSYAGIALVVFAIVLFVVDIKAPSHGVLTAGGVVSLALGSFFILDAGAPFLQPNLALAILPPVGVGLLLAFLVSKAVAARRRPLAAGTERLIGAEGQAREDVGPKGGLVMVDGALWQAHSDAPIPRGSRLRVRAISGLHLEVEAAEAHGIPLVPTVKHP